MPIAAEHAFKEKSTKSLILLPLRTIYNRTFQCETPCSKLPTTTFKNAWRAKKRNNFMKTGKNSMWRPKKVNLGTHNLLKKPIY